MKRDWDLAREVLRQVEESPDGIGPKWVELEIEGRSQDEVSYHVQLLDEAGLIKAVDLTTMGNFHVLPRRLTWLGHEFLDAAREDTRWEKAKRLVFEKTGSVSFAALQQVLLEGIKRSL